NSDESIALAMGSVTDKDGYYQGNPEYAHYPLFEDVLDDFEATEEERQSYQPTEIAHQVRLE
ncbi:hypothetical protein, partial [Klebsiella aerogenes]